jgi:GxxExxY protein
MTYAIMEAYFCSSREKPLREEKDILKLCDAIRQIAFDLHVYLRHGHLEKVYENGLAHRILKAGFNVVQQHPLQVRDEDGVVLGNYCADLFVEDCLIVELKACKALVAEHTGQVLGYLRASGQRDALLINFGYPKIEIKKLKL